RGAVASGGSARREDHARLGRQAYRNLADGSRLKRARPTPPHSNDPSSMVRRRHVFYVEGYDPQGFAGYIVLFRREFERFLKLWPLKAAMSEPQLDQAAHTARWSMSASAPNWQVAASYEMLAWHDLAEADLAKPLLTRLPGIVGAYGDFLVSGTLFRIFRA